MMWLISVKRCVVHRRNHLGDSRLRVRPADDRRPGFFCRWLEFRNKVLPFQRQLFVGPGNVDVLRLHVGAILSHHRRPYREPATHRFVDLLARSLLALFAGSVQ